MNQFCKSCNKTLNHVLKHLAKSSKCKASFSTEELNVLRKNCQEEVKNRRNAKRRQNYDPEAESIKRKMKSLKAKNEQQKTV